MQMVLRLSPGTVFGRNNMMILAQDRRCTVSLHTTLSAGSHHSAGIMIAMMIPADAEQLREQVIESLVLEVCGQQIGL